MSKKLITVALFFLFFHFSSPVTSAACKEARPNGPPILMSAVSHDKSVTLVWVEAPDPVTYYLVRYGLSKDNMPYGNPNVGGRGTNSYTVSDLANGTKYYFQVRAGNGCKPGKYSNALDAMPGGVQTQAAVVKRPKSLSIYKQVLGTNTTATKEAKVKIDPIPAPVAISKDVKKSCVFNCNGGPFLLAETVLLVYFFALVRKQSRIKPLYSIIIPLITTGAFYAIYKGCGSYEFVCKYFIPLNAIIYVTILIIQKNILFQFHKQPV